MTEPDAAVQPPLAAPYPWPGGKALATPLIWQAFGQVQNFVEPFFGAGATFLRCPYVIGTETINDIDAYVVNVLRALAADPETVAAWCAWPITEADVHARHLWLLAQQEDFTAHLMGDPHWYDAKVAGWWLWGICAWIGNDWCSGRGPWHSVDGRMVKTTEDGTGVFKQLPRLGHCGMGVHRQGVSRRLPRLKSSDGVHRSSLGAEGLLGWFQDLQRRFRRARITCGDAFRVLGPSVTWHHGLSGILLDPPYSQETGRYMQLYRHESGTVAADCRQWCVENGHQRLLRVVLCGYDGEHDALLAHGWRKVHWSANGGMGNQRKDRSNQNRHRETLYLSPHCLHTVSQPQMTLFTEDGPHGDA